MTALPPSPFLTEMSSPAGSHSVEKSAGASPSSSPAKASASAGSRFDRHFNPRKFLHDIAIGLPFMSEAAFCELTGEELPPLFLSDPSDDFIAAMHRDVLPMLETLARRG